ncbi:MAG: hypothetical protein GWP75_00305 [Planctomycetia bacterium]|nr:hypothetical protein [Planctomycetia bacterium]
MSDSGIARASLATHPEAELDDPRLPETIVAAARGIAERTGVDLVEIEWRAGGLAVAVRGPDITAIGLLAELRRSTDRWHRDHGGGPLWQDGSTDRDPNA